MKKDSELTTHDVARLLTRLAHLLRSGPNVALDALQSSLRVRASRDPAQIPVALSTLVSLSEFDKQQWLNFIDEYKFPIAVSPKDSSRNILGKLLSYLETDSEARKRLTTAAQRTRPETSPELVRALQFLLNS